MPPLTYCSPKYDNNTTNLLKFCSDFDVFLPHIEGGVPPLDVLYDLIQISISVACRSEN